MMAALFGLAGLIAGSFLNVVIHRVPRSLSVVSPPSACPHCGHRLTARDNIPVLSFLVLRGRCRTCGAPISPRYLVVEVANAAMWVLAALVMPGIEEAAFVAAASSVLLALSVIDLEHKRLPNSIVLPATAVALVWVAGLSAAVAEPRILAEAAASGAAAFALFFVIAFVSGGMGFGDVKLAAFVGVVAGRFGWEVALVAVVSSFFVGGVVSLALIATKRRSRKDAIPFGPSLAAGAILAIYGGPDLAARWFGAF